MELTLCGRIVKEEHNWSDMMARFIRNVSRNGTRPQGEIKDLGPKKSCLVRHRRVSDRPLISITLAAFLAADMPERYWGGGW